MSMFHEVFDSMTRSSMSLPDLVAMERPSRKLIVQEMATTSMCLEWNSVMLNPFKAAMDFNFVLMKAQVCITESHPYRNIPVVTSDAVEVFLHSGGDGVYEHKSTV